MFLGHISTFFETFKPYSQETAQNFEKRVLQKGLRIPFYTYIPVNLHHFLKKHHNHCTLVYTSTVCKGGEYGAQKRGRGLRQIKHLPQSPSTGFI